MNKQYRRVQDVLAKNVSLDNLHLKIQDKALKYIERKINEKKVNNDNGENAANLSVYSIKQNNQNPNMQKGGQIFVGSSQMGHPQMQHQKSSPSQNNPIFK